MEKIDTILDEHGIVFVKTAVGQLEKAKEEVKYFKQMYKLAKDKKASRIFILNSLLNQAFETAALGYLAAKNLNKTKEKNEFEMDCTNFARVGEQLSKVAYGSTHNGWTERKNNIDENGYS